MWPEIRYRFMADAGAPALLAANDWTAARRRKKRGAKKSSSAALFGPPLRSADELKRLLARHYLLARYATGAKPIAWVTSGAPVEILRAFGIYCIYPENHAALCGAQKMGPEIATEAENRGYSRDLCSYARCDLGTLFSGKTPVGRLPKPDLLFCTTNICQTLLYWYRVIAEERKIPLFLIDTPFLTGEPAEHELGYVRRQLDEAIAGLETFLRRDFDFARFQRIAALAKEGSELWGQVLAQCKARPAPMTVFDAFVHIAPVVALRGLEECNDYYRGLVAELKERVERGIGGIANERKRLLWDNIPVWFKLGDFSKLFAARGANFVVATYTNAWAEGADRIDPSRPLESMALVYTDVILNRGLGDRKRLIRKLIGDYSVDGAVLHSNRSCKPYSLGAFDMRERLREEAGIPALVLEADQTDARCWSEEQGGVRIQAFLDSLLDEAGERGPSAARAAAPG